MAKKQITVTLQVKELLFDIENKTHLTGQSRQTEGQATYEAVSRMQASDEETILYQLKRSINDNFAALKTDLAEYLDESKTTANNLIMTAVDSEGALTLVFSMPSNFNHAAIDSLSNGVHDYIVYKTVSEWFTISNKADAADYQTMAAAALTTAEAALYKRTRPTYTTDDSE